MVVVKPLVFMGVMMIEAQEVVTTSLIAVVKATMVKVRVMMVEVLERVGI